MTNETTDWYNLDSIAERIETLDGPARSDTVDEAVYWLVTFGPGVFELRAPMPALDVDRVRWCASAITQDVWVTLTDAQATRIMPYLRKFLAEHHRRDGAMRPLGHGI